ncbi:MAG: ATP-binding protein [Nitrospirota bacterium]
MNNEKHSWPLKLDASITLQSLPDGVFITDPQMRIIYFNLAAERMTGFKSYEAVGMYCKDVLKSGLCSTDCVVKRALDSDQNIFNIETTITTVTGQIIPALVSASLLKDSTGKIVGYLYSFRDILLLKKVMSDLEISRAELAEKNIELTQTLTVLKSTHEQLLQAQKMEAMGTLAGGIAHDFNNILTGILGFASLAKSELPEDNPVYKYIEQIERSAKRASELTGAILTFARRSRFEIKTVDINKIVAGVWRILEMTVDRSIDIEKALSPTPCYIDVDVSKMEQALMNICVNAIEAMPKGGILTIKTEVSSNISDIDVADLPEQIKEDGYVKISIIDTGAGMDEETRQKIFDPFFTTKGKTGGTGLGLAVVYGVINEFRGYIDVKSKPGVGTTFTLYLPISKQTVEAKVSVEEEAPEIPRGNGETILLIDDEKIILELGKNLLERLGYNVVIAENGFEAAALYKRLKDEVSLVVLDLIMPILSGKEVFERLRQINPTAKILISTGYAKDEIIQPLLEKGAKGFLEKPYNIYGMAESVRKALETKD